jgi:predicted RNase H-like nuclease (RuvC/YqgF family)
MTMNIEAEIRDLKRRVSEIEGSFGFLTQQLKSVHKDLLSFQERTEQKFEKVDGRFDRLEKEIRDVRKEVGDLRKDMPGIVGNTMREVLRESAGQSPKK